MPPHEALPDDDRDRGILTKADREFLRGKKDLENEQSRRDARYRIRNRIRNAILDLSIILHHLDEDDLNLVFDPFYREYDSHDEFISSADSNSVKQLIEDTMFISGVKDGVGLFYKGTYDSDFPFEELLASGIKDVESQHGYVVDDVTVDIDIEKNRQLDLNKLIARFEEGEPVTKSELTAILRSGDFDISEENLDRLFSGVLEDSSEELHELSDFDDRDDESNTSST